MAKALLNVAFVPNSEVNGDKKDQIIIGLRTLGTRFCCSYICCARIIYKILLRKRKILYGIASFVNVSKWVRKVHCIVYDNELLTLQAKATTVYTYKSNES